MSLTKGMLIEGIVTKVENNGLTMKLSNGDTGFLAKENMHISKKKKLTDIFSIGYVIKATVLFKKENYYTLTQKEINTKDNTKDNKKSNKKEKNRKKEEHREKKLVNNTNKQKKVKEKVIETKNNKKNKDDDDNPISKGKTTLTDLKKLKNIGNLKISVKKNKTNISEKQQPKEENSKIIVDIPENFVENIVQDLEIKTKQFNNLVARVKERGLLDEN